MGKGGGTTTILPRVKVALIRGVCEPLRAAQKRGKEEGTEEGEGERGMGANATLTTQR